MFKPTLSKFHTMLWPTTQSLTVISPDIVLIQVKCIEVISSVCVMGRVCSLYLDLFKGLLNCRPCYGFDKLMQRNFYCNPRFHYFSASLHCYQNWNNEGKSYSVTHYSLLTMSAFNKFSERYKIILLSSVFREKPLPKH